MSNYPQATTDGTQRWRITTSTYLSDSEDNDHIGTTVEYESYPHTERLGQRDWISDVDIARGVHVDEREFDENGNLVYLAASSFDTEFDRNAQQSYPVWVTRQYQLEAFG